MPDTSTVRGTVIKVPDATPGLVIVHGGQKSFTLEGVWHSPVAPAPNMTVDVFVDAGGAVVGMTAVDAQQITKETLDRLGGIAQQQGKEAAEIAKQGVGALAARMGTTALVATVVLWVAWFFLPAVKLDFFVLNRSFTFWEFLAMDLTNPQSPTGSRGLLGFVGLLAIAAPFARPFLRHAKARYLNVAPLAFLTIGTLLVYWRLSGGAGSVDEGATLAEMMRAAQQEAARAIVESMSVSVGAIVLLIPAIFLAVKGLKRDA